MFKMVAIPFSALLLIALTSIASELIMRIRLSIHEVKGEKLLWWRRGGDAVASEYREVFSQSILLSFRAYAFWGFVVIVLLLCVKMFLRRHAF